ncbi:MAG TPA: ATP-binding protein [Bacteroidales bacterium]|nr:ATP-binding protein [Bacteroidales bacterium]
MKKRIPKLTKAQLLRQKAEKLLKAKNPDIDSISNEFDVMKLNQELAVHQIELEIQNAELIEAKENLEVAVEVALNKYIELYDFAPTGYLNLSKQGQIIGLNLSASKMLGKERQSLIKNLFGSFITDNTKQHYYHFLKEIFSSQKEQTCEVTLFRKDNSPIQVYLIGQVDKNHRTCTVSMIDITDRKNAEKERNELLHELTVSNKELAEFAYVASHDLQEPLRMVTSFMQLLSTRYKDKLDDNALEYIQFAVDGAKRMYDLLNGLLAYSRVHTKGTPFRKVDTNHVLSNVLSNLTFLIKERRAEIKFNDLPVVIADETQLTQLFQNLIQNSIKFSTKPPRIYISSTSVPDHYMFSIKDEGIGIESQYFEKIFKIFQRLMPKEHYDGIGIGLAICKRIVERHNGEIWLESELGKGSTFYFTIPKVEESKL